MAKTGGLLRKVEGVEAKLSNLHILNTMEEDLWAAITKTQYFPGTQSSDEANVLNPMYLKMLSAKIRQNLRKLEGVEAKVSNYHIIKTMNAYLWPKNGKSRALPSMN